MNDLTILYVTANVISPTFGKNTRDQLVAATGDMPIVCMSKEKMPWKVWRFGKAREYTNIVTDGKRSHIGIYRDALLGAKEIKTKYMAFVEDDVLYAPEHFQYRPRPSTFAYNVATWGIYTWIRPATFNWRVRRNNNGLICETALYIETMQERFKKYELVLDNEINLSTWAEPGRYEGNLHLTKRKIEDFMTHPGNIMFSHPTGSQHLNLGEKKAMGKLRAYDIPYWGKAEDILSLYE